MTEENNTDELTVLRMHTNYIKGSYDIAVKENDSLHSRLQESQNHLNETEQRLARARGYLKALAHMDIETTSIGLFFELQKSVQAFLEEE